MPAPVAVGAGKAGVRLLAGGCAEEETALEAKRRLAEKFGNFRSAVQCGKSRTEEASNLRGRRYDILGERAKDAGDPEEVQQCFIERETAALRLKRRQWSTNDLDPICILGEGAYGQVHLVNLKGTDKHFALKQMKKSRYQRKNYRERAFAEREILAEARTRWFVELHATFQDSAHVFMLMEFIQGGDLFKYLEEKVRFTPYETAFYMAELLEALDIVHRHGFVHRDVKPDNVVLTAGGHLKLLDFGLCKHEAEPEEFRGGASRRAKLQSRVGTPQYMAPESFQGEVGAGGDIWALGVVMFECLYGGVPFHAGHKEGHEAIAAITQQVMNHATVFPKRLQKAESFGLMPPDAERLLRRVICHESARLGADALRKEPFFAGLDFGRLHLLPPPIRPKVSGPADASNFDDSKRRQLLPQPSGGARKDAKLEWAHYEFDRETRDLELPEGLEQLFQPSEDRRSCDLR